MSTEKRTVAGIPGVEKIPPAALRAIVDTADSLGIAPDWLLAVETFESGFNPAAVNKFSGATGAIQWMPSTAINLGTTVAALKQMTLEEQQKYVYLYLRGFKGRMKSLEDTYLAVFMPSLMGKSDDAIAGQREGGSTFQAAVYKQNAGFDSSGSGVITRGNIVRTIRNVAASANGRPRVEVPGPPTFRNALLFGLFGVASWGIVRWGLGR